MTSSTRGDPDLVANGEGGPNNSPGNGDTGLAALLVAGQVRKVICSFPRQTDSCVFDGLFRASKIELELVPQGSSRGSSTPVKYRCLFGQLQGSGHPRLRPVRPFRYARIGGALYLVISSPGSSVRC